MGHTAITAPPARPPRYSLVTVAEDAGLSGPALAAGFTFDPELCGNSRGGVVAIDCTGNHDPRDPATNPEVVEADPFMVWASDECSTFGHAARDWTGRAQRALRAVESYWIARELWTGSLGLSQGFLAGTASDVVTSGPTEVLDALGLIEGGLAVTLRGQPGMVHMTPQVLAHAVGAQVLWRDGALWRTPMGHVVVADAGYDGSGPSGADPTSTQWIYGSSLVSVSLGPVETIPGSFADAKSQAEAITRTVNLVTVYSDRLAAYVWDGCGHVAAQVDVPVALVGGS